jgi:hypothetical protein
VSAGSSRWRAVVPAAVGVLAGSAAGAQAVLSPVVALANNGDFNRVLTSLGLRPQGSNRFPFPFAQLRFVDGHMASSGAYWTSYLPGLKAVTSAVTLVTGGSFDLRVLGALYSVALGVLVFAFCRRFGSVAAQIAVGAVLVVGLSDARLVAYFNSFYDEPWSLLVLGACVVAVLANDGRRVVSTRAQLTWAALGALLVTAKSQDASLFVPVAGAALLLSSRPRPGHSRRVRKILPVACAVAVTVIAGGYLAIQPAVYSHDNLYDQVFADLLVHSPHPRADLAWLGLPPSMIQFAGTNAYAATTGYNTPTFQHFAAHGGREKVEAFYLDHPSEAVGALLRGVKAGMQAHLAYLDYRTAASGAPVGADGCGLCFLSKGLSGTGPSSPAPVVLLDGVAVAAAILLRRRGRNGVSDAIVFLLVVSAVALLTAVFGEGSYEEIKHLYLFYVANLLLLAITAGASLTAGAGLLALSAPWPAGRWRRSTPGCGPSTSPGTERGRPGR